MASLARANLVARKGRTIISVLTVALGTTLLLLLVGFTRGTLREVATRMMRTNADILVMGKGANPLIATNMSTLDMMLCDELKKIPGIASATPVAMNQVNVHNQPTRMYGLIREDLINLLGDQKMLKGRMFEDEFECVIDNRMASVERLTVGDTVPGPRGTTFTVAGIVEAGVLGRIYVPMKTLQEVVKDPDAVWAFLIGCTDGSRAPKVAERIERKFTHTSTILVRNYFQVLARSLKEMQYVVKGIIALTMLMSFLVILLAMYTSVVERTREIGVLKALGAGRAFIIREVLTESTIIAIVGVLVGIGLSFVGRVFIEKSYPHYCVELAPLWLSIAVALGLIAGISGALLPALRASKQDPITALSYE